MKVIQEIYCDKIPKLNQKCMDSVDAVFGKENIIRNIFPSIKNPIKTTDIKRFGLILEAHYTYPGEIILWPDWDIEFFDDPKWNFKGPAFGFSVGSADNYLIYSPGPQWIIKMFEIQKMRGILPVYGWCRKIFREVPHEEIKPDQSWKHHNTTGYAAGLKEYAEIENADEYFFNPIIEKIRKENEKEELKTVTRMKKEKKN